jgi:hypothetical protein
MDKSTLQAEGLSHAVSGQSLTNYPVIIVGFAAKGIPTADIKPRDGLARYLKV